jgi:hypothetical protein
MEEESQQVVINAPAGTYEDYGSVSGRETTGLLGTLTIQEEPVSDPSRQLAGTDRPT